MIHEQYKSLENELLVVESSKNEEDFFFIKEVIIASNKTLYPVVLNGYLIQKNISHEVAFSFHEANSLLKYKRTCITLSGRMVGYTLM